MTLQKKEKVLDYLFEDPPLATQKFALVSIVGPNMPQKCDIWGLKIRGVAGTIDEAKKLSQKILRVDNIIVCAGQTPQTELLEELRGKGVAVHLIGGAEEARELDAKRAIDRGARLAAEI